MDVSTLLVAAVIFAATYLQSATGFGLALVCMAVIPLVIPVEDAIACVAIASFFVNFFIFFANRAGFSFRKALPLSIGIILGIPIGYYALRGLDGKMIIRLLGIALMAISAWDFIQGRFASKFVIPEKAGGVFGLIGGVLAGAFNVGGPPIVVYTYSRPWAKVEAVAILQTVFIAGGTTRNLLMVHEGEYTRELLTMVGWSLPGCLVAVWLGKLTLDRVPQVLLRKIVFALIFFIGLRYIISP